MDTNSTRAEGLWIWLRDQCLQDPRKTLLLLVLAAIAVAVIASGLSGGSGPRQVSAARPASPAPAAVPAPQGDTGPQAADRRQRDEYLAQLDLNVERDIFAVDYAAYPLLAPEPVNPNLAPVVRPPTVNPAVIAAQQRQARIAALQAKARTLSLQSTMGTTAIINGQVVGPGQGIAGFTVKRVGAGECVLAAEGVEITLHMK